MTVEQTTVTHPSTFPMLEDKIALVTGAGLGVGRAGAMAMARHGAQAVVTDLDVDRAAEVVEDLHSEGVQAASAGLAFPSPLWRG